MAKKIYRALIISLLVFILMSITAVPAMAFETRSGTSVTIGSGETIDGDLYIVATICTIDGTVNGDIFAIGQTINVNGNVNGGVSLAAMNVDINGTVTGGARVAAQTLRVNGSIGRDLIASAYNVNLSQTSEIGGDVNLFSGTGNLGGSISGTVTGSIENLTISGTIQENVNIRVDNLTLASSAVIQGNLTYTSRDTANIESGATVAGTTSQILPEEREGRGLLPGIAGLILGGIWGYLAIFIIGIVLIFTMMRRMKKLALSIRYHPGECLGWGALIFFATPIAAILVMVTVIGIPLGIISLVIWGILLYFAQIPVAITIGWLILSRKRDISSHGLLIGALALGLFILYLIGSIPIIGWILMLFVIFFGLGSLVTVFRAAPNNYKIAATQ